MFNFKKKSQLPAVQAVPVYLNNARDRAQPFQFNLHSSDLVGLLIEAVHLGKLLASEQRDLEVIRNDYKLKAAFLENQHNEVITMLQHTYTERSQAIEVINERAKQLIESGNIQAGEALLNKLIDMVANNSPLRSAMEMRNQRLLT